MPYISLLSSPAHRPKDMLSHSFSVWSSRLLVCTTKSTKAQMGGFMLWYPQPPTEGSLVLNGFLQAEEGLYTRCSKGLVPSHAKNCEKLLAWTRQKGVFDRQRKPSRFPWPFPFDAPVWSPLHALAAWRPFCVTYLSPWLGRDLHKLRHSYKILL